MDENDPIPEMYYLDLHRQSRKTNKKKKDFIMLSINHFVSLYAPIEGDKNG